MSAHLRSEKRCPSKTRLQGDLCRSIARNWIRIVTSYHSPFSHAVYDALVNFLEHPQPQFDASLADEVVALGTTIGLVRKENQDRHIVAKLSCGQAGFWVVAVADGVGSLPDSGKAASACLAAFVTSLAASVSAVRNRGSWEWPQLLANSVRDANETVVNETKERGASTLSAVVQTETGAFGVHVGDSKIFAFDEKRRLIKITKDQTVGSHLKSLGVGEQSQTDPRFERALAQYMGMADTVVPDVFAVRPPHKTLIACSDGIAPVLKLLNEEGWRLLCENAKSGVELVKKTLHLSNWFGGGDNCTVAIWDPSALKISFPPISDVTVLTFHSVSRSSSILYPHVRLPGPSLIAGAPIPESKAVAIDRRVAKGSKSKSPKGRAAQRRKTKSEGASQSHKEVPSVTFLPGLGKGADEYPGKI
jgi:serine/threonine protein phosphatase PrpC